MNKIFIPVFIVFMMISNITMASYGLPDTEKLTSLEELIKKAEDGDMESQKNLGFAYEFGKVGAEVDDKKAIYWYEKAVEQGDYVAMRLLGKMHKLGIGTEQNDEKSLKLFMQSAEGGNDISQILLGIMHDVGDGVERNDEAAFKWFKKAAEQGNIEGQHFLGTMYELGRGIPENYVEAFAWYNIAGSQGKFLAEKSKEDLRDKMSKDDISRAQSLSKEYHSKFVKPM